MASIMLIRPVDNNANSFLPQGRRGSFQKMRHKFPRPSDRIGKYDHFWLNLPDFSQFREIFGWIKPGNVSKLKLGA